MTEVQKPYQLQVKKPTPKNRTQEPTQSPTFNKTRSRRIVSTEKNPNETREKHANRKPQTLVLLVRKFPACISTMPAMTQPLASCLPVSHCPRPDVPSIFHHPAPMQFELWSRPALHYILLHKQNQLTKQLAKSKIQDPNSKIVENPKSKSKIQILDLKWRTASKVSNIRIQNPKLQNQKSKSEIQKSKVENPKIRNLRSRIKNRKSNIQNRSFGSGHIEWVEVPRQAHHIKSPKS